MKIFSTIEQIEEAEEIRPLRLLVGHHSFKMKKTDRNRHWLQNKLKFK